VNRDFGGTLFPPIRRLATDDLKACVALSVDRGWSPEKAKWSLLLTASEAFGIDAPDGRGLAGAVVLTRWGPDLASIGMMLVAGRYGRRGIGRALMEHVLAAAGPKATVTLFATDMGRPLYETLGFRPVRRNVSFVGRFDGAQSSRDNSKKRGALAAMAPATSQASLAVQAWPVTSRPAVATDLDEILAVDRAAFGADRSRILACLPGLAEGIQVLDAGEKDRSAIVGYATAWRNIPTTTIIGPVVAPTADAAKLLIAGLAAETSTQVRLDLDPDRPELPGWAHAHGLEPVSRTVVMAHGELVFRGTPEHLHAPISVALA
jgi:GNAT superfamily N-acetyltransferase